MAQVLEKEKKFDQSIEKYLLCCDGIERVSLMNPGARIEMHWVVLSLGKIADIYMDRCDYEKSIAYRNAQKCFLDYMSTQKRINASGSDDEDVTTENFAVIASAATVYRKLFKKVRQARDVPDKPPQETPEELMKRLMDAREKDEEARIDRTIRMLEEATAAREREIRNSFWKRNIQRIADHPFAFMFFVLVIAICVVLFVRFRPKKKVHVPGGIEGSTAYLEKYMREYEKKHGIKSDRGHGHNHGFGKDLDKDMFGL
jgi:hypothetical protein